VLEVGGGTKTAPHKTYNNDLGQNDLLQLSPTGRFSWKEFMGLAPSDSTRIGAGLDVAGGFVPTVGRSRGGRGATGIGQPARRCFDLSSPAPTADRWPTCRQEGALLTLDDTRVDRRVHGSWSRIAGERPFRAIIGHDLISRASRVALARKSKTLEVVRH